MPFSCRIRFRSPFSSVIIRRLVFPHFDEKKPIEQKLRNGLISKTTAIMLANPQYSKREAMEELERVKSEGSLYSGRNVNNLDALLGSDEE